MRVVLALMLPVVFVWSATAEAATQHHQRVRPHVVNRPSEQVVPMGRYIYPGFGPIPPGENRNLDPSTRGSG